MSTVRINVEPTVIKNAVLKSGRNFEEVKKRFKNFEKWISNELDPTYNQLVDLSKFLRIPFGFLLVKTPIEEELPLLEFRTVDTDAIENPSRELIDTIYDMERKQEWLRDTFVNDGSEPFHYVGMFKNNADINYLKASSIIRETFGLDEKWFKRASKKNTFNILRDLLSRHGVVIMQNGVAINNTHRPLNLDEFRAFTLVDKYAPFIFINNLDSVSGKTFSLLHELAHIFFGMDSLYNEDFQHRNKYTSSIEIICNKIAGEIVAPTHLFITSWEYRFKHESNLKETIEKVSQEFKVSKLVIGRKALEQKFINQKQYDDIAVLVKDEFELSRKNNERQKGGNPINNALSRLDEKFVKALISNTEYGMTQYNEAYRLAGVSRGVFEDISEHLKGVR